MAFAIESLLNEITSCPRIPNVYSKKVLSNRTHGKTLSYQRKHIINLISILLEKSIALDGSETGTGKTYMAIATCIELGKRPIIICPKTIMFNWLIVCDYFGVKPYEIVNYETIRTGKSYTNYEFNYRMESAFIKIVEENPGKTTQYVYEWTVPEDAMLIFDEAHRCKSVKTDNGQLLMSTKNLILKRIPILLASATICEKIADMKIPCYLFGLIPNTKRYNYYLKNLSDKYPSLNIRKTEFTEKKTYDMAKENTNSMMIYQEVKNYMSRIKISELGDKFPVNQFCAQQFIADESEIIAKAYEELAYHLKELKKRQTKANHHLARITKLKQEIEIRKIPIFIEQAKLYLDDGKSVIIFVNYLKTLDILRTKLDIKCVINGDQNLRDRKKAIDLFQSNQENKIICQIESGGVGISLHDIHGGHPRAVLLNYPGSASGLLQALGRAHRSGMKTPVIQRIICVANVPYEKNIMDNINKKLKNISAINDGDLNGYEYDVMMVN
jgi:hypothetical protein